MRQIRSAAIGLLLFISACHSGSRSAQFGGTTISRNDTTGFTTLSNKGGTISTALGTAAQSVELPAYAPRYPGSTVESALDTSDKNSHARIIRLDTSEPAANVLPFYRKALVSIGFAIDMDLQLPGGGGMVVGKTQDQTCLITVETMDGKTAIVLSVSDRS